MFNPTNYQNLSYRNMKSVVIFCLIIGASIVKGTPVKSPEKESSSTSQDTTINDLTESVPKSSSLGKIGMAKEVNISSQGVAVPVPESPDEVCPCMVAEACKTDDKRHVFGTDQLDITKFGLISPCLETDHFPCCPVNPPPPKTFNLTAADFSGLSKAELIQLGVLNDKGIIGSSSIPLIKPEQLNLLEAHKTATATKTQQQLLRPAPRPVHLAYPPTYSVPQIFQQSFLYNNRLYRPVGFDSRFLLLRRL